jgi:hypothetical protein
LHQTNCLSLLNQSLQKEREYNQMYGHDSGGVIQVLKGKGGKSGGGGTDNIVMILKAWTEHEKKAPAHEF